ncbi:hypothetical protein M9H77_12154 [Catharanthus roseus]|uniref:Uncharacterized protein n=1 Tax=Catharanthus roseus TaxID=4058 RepID=A0ACC0BGN6_CATRO|nr:hypothetical protein M9H77_12154 [Catharanthus roseus]
MGSVHHVRGAALFLYFLLWTSFNSSAAEIDLNQSAWLSVDASQASARKISETMFGISFEEINHAGAGGLWAELVSNRGFEAGGENVPSNIHPWHILGDESLLIVSTERSSCFDRNKVALRMEVLCDNEGANICPVKGVGIYNPGYWGMNIEQGKTYKVVLYVRSLESINVSISLTGSSGLETLANTNIVAANISSWSKVEVRLTPRTSDHNARLQLTTAKKGVIWFDQVSAMPLDTFKGHGFRNDLFQMLADLRPGFIRFPGGSFVEGEWLRNAFHWKATVGPWEERPGHFNEVWQYWTDDGLGLFEFLQLAEDLGALPVWVFNCGISHSDQVDSSTILPFVQEIIDGIEFARGDPNSTWGYIRAAMGHPEPYDLRYVAIGNQDCWKKNYHGNYMKFYLAIKSAYPDIKIISNCDGSSQALDHPADLYDVHVYGDANYVFSLAHKFDRTMRGGPKAFVSEYAVNGKDAGRGNLLAALALAGFLIGLERNSDVVEMASNAPLFVNENDRRWNPDAIVFDSYQVYGTPNYWMQQFFRESNGATVLNSRVQSKQASTLASIIASAILWRNPDNESSSSSTLSYLRIKVVNLGINMVKLKIVIDNLKPRRSVINVEGCRETVLTSANLMDENSFQHPTKVAPILSPLKGGNYMNVALSPHSFTSLDLLLTTQSHLTI